MNLTELAKMTRRCWPPETANIVGKDYGSETPVVPWYIVARDAINRQLYKAEDRIEAIATIKVIVFLVGCLVVFCYLLSAAIDTQIEHGRQVVEGSRGVDR